VIRINRATEYGLMALSYMESYSPSRKSAREIAEHLHLPFEITAKTLQRLKETGFVESSQGTNGGYKLAHGLSTFTLAQLMEAIEGPQNLVGCLTLHDGKANDCELSGGCEIQKPIARVNSRIKELLSSITLAEVIAERKDDIQ
jgi:Rrf2 family protein